MMSTLQINDNGKIKIASGLLLTIAGIAGLLFGKNIKQKIVRITVLILSALCLGSGFYLFVSGVDDFAFGQVDHYVIGGALFQPITSPNPEDYKQEVEAVFLANPAIRRLHYKCADGSMTLKIFNTKFGVFGIPKDSVICDNGTALLLYTKAWDNYKIKVR